MTCIIGLQVCDFTVRMAGDPMRSGVIATGVKIGWYAQPRKLIFSDLRAMALPPEVHY